MRKQYAITVLLTASFAVVLAAVPLRHLALTPAQAQQEGQRSHQSGVPIVGPDVSPESVLPTLELTGYQAKAIVLDAETFAAQAGKLSPGVPTDLTRYHLRLIHHNLSSSFSGIFERDGVPVPTPAIEVKDSDDPGITIDGADLKALLVVTQTIRDPKRKMGYNFDYDITNYDVRIQRDAKIIHVYCNSHIFGTYWTKLANSPSNQRPEVVGHLFNQASDSWRFDVSRDSYQIVQTYLTSI